ncbi:uncharacterized protein LOC135171779 [Diachasmimorpha longicaudata]|uniref:uncharacterized protein LOC135171779 n=1 Tax=Diachasmimorpha longicaudata TaxID=58733 RepID=UPI0030B86BF0
MTRTDRSLGAQRSNYSGGHHSLQGFNFLDTGSTSNFITEKLARQLNLPLENLKIPIMTVADPNLTTNHLMKATIRSRVNEYSRDLNFLTVSSLGGILPSEPIDRNSLKIPRHLALADPRFDQPAPFDILLSSGTTLALLCQGQIRLNNTHGTDVLLQETQLGWIIGGSVSTRNPLSMKQITNNHLTCVEQQLKNFWEMDDVNTEKHLSSEEVACEEHFKEHVTRDETGRYIVALPFNNNKSKLGESREMAKNRFHSLQRKFRRNPELEKQYSAVMQEYLDLGHMSESREDPSEEKGFYLPHHAVIKATSLTTKVRVVFDGSAKRAGDPVSLNESLMIGPTIQEDIFSLLTRFLTHQYVLTGDIEKMYRQFWVRDEDRKYQRVWWKDSNGEPRVFELNTVTFGLSSAPYLAIRCLHQLADDESEKFPEAAKIIKRDLYVDDLLTGADTLEEALNIRDGINSVLKKGQLNLRQWGSNDPRLLEGLAEGNINLQLKTSNDPTIKTLGLHWNSEKDAIIFTVQPIQPRSKVTKRTMLSDVSKIFDPLGFLGPVIIKGRMILHRLWEEKIGWDDIIPLSILTEWKTYSTQLTKLNNISFNRRVIIPEAREIQLHGFCDASTKGYGACIYLRSTDVHGETIVRLLCSKYRVAPIKPVTLPRLELCSALLLSDLYTATKQSINRHIDKIVFWSDSMIALHWIKSSPSKSTVFVANRIVGIQQKTEGAEWRHVRSQDNPADHISRGLFPNEFLLESNWKTGPIWLEKNENEWPRSELIVPAVVPELKKVQCFLTDPGVPAQPQQDPKDLPYVLRFSSLTFLRRLFAYGLRLKPGNNFKGPPSAEELNFANERIIKIVQESVFAEEIKELKKEISSRPKIKYMALSLLLDKKGLLRVGGRLENSDLPFEQKHPLLIPKEHHITTLLIREEHLINHHAGAQTTLYALRRKYWLVGGRAQVRKIIKKCIPCTKANPPQSEYIMGNLPRTRITEARPFYNVGVDYCGPFYLKEKKHRNRNKIKVWVAVFVCMVVKAVHIEVVTDLTTEEFIAALKRFIGRRGKPRNIYSDNGTNFVGANNEIKELYALARATDHNERIHKHLADQGITWHFIPPLSPHQGGLWEAGVKSFKYHLKRICDDLITLTEFNTLVIEIEATLNSRPLTPISTDPNDILVLSPGHFLIGDSLTSLPEPDLRCTPDNKLSCWETIQKKQQEFWARWHKEYLNEQNQRNKWTKGSHNIKEDTIVILRDDNLPPRQWSLGRHMTNKKTHRIVSSILFAYNNPHSSKFREKTHPFIALTCKRRGIELVSSTIQQRQDTYSLISPNTYYIRDFIT